MTTSRGRGRPGGGGRFGPSRQGPRPGREPGRPGGPSQRQTLTYPIPRATAAAWRAWQPQAPQNAGLIFDRFVPAWHDGRDGNAGLVKKQGLEAVRAAAAKADAALLAAWNARWQAAAREARAEVVSLCTDWRLITGLGRKGPLEVGFTFHRYGFPYLPGSSVKGLARARALIAVAEALGEDSLAAVAEAHRRETRGKAEVQPVAALLRLLEIDASDAFARRWEQALGGGRGEARERAEAFRAIFGTTAASGGAIFFDAIPAAMPHLELDIMNPHVPEYYRDGGKTPPASWQSPVPVYFLTVAPGTEFRFAVAWRGTLDDMGRARRALAKHWLMSALTELGAGAKTGAGYGYFLPASTTSTSTMAEAAAAPVTEPAATAAAPATSSAVAEPPLVWRTGTVLEYQPNPGRGRLVDDETNEELRFTRDAITDKGWSPGRKTKVRYAVREVDGRRTVVRVEKA
jgi:CRISPR-associated protein Cmr6